MSDTAIVGENVEVIQAQAGRPRSAFRWGVVIAGALAAWAVAFIFISLGAGIGLTVASPYSGPSAGTLGIAGAIWLLFSETIAFATGGYLAARLRIRDHLPGPETTFRDGAHGFMVWVVGASAMAVAVFAASAFSVGTAANVASSAAGVAAIAAGDNKGQNPAAYYVDRLFRTDPRRQTSAAGGAGGAAAANPSATSAPMPFATTAPPSGNAAPPAQGGTPPSDRTAQAGNPAGNETNRPAPAAASSSPQSDRQDSGGQPLSETQRSEATRIIAASLADGKLDDSDKQYLAQLVAARTGMTQAEANMRVTEVTNAATEKLKQAAETTRKAGAYLSFWSFMALLFGAVAATLAGILGGELRDEV
jgi:hypothetical protein